MQLLRHWLDAYLSKQENLHFKIHKNNLATLVSRRLINTHNRLIDSVNLAMLLGALECLGVILLTTGLL